MKKYTHPGLRNIKIRMDEMFSISTLNLFYSTKGLLLSQLFTITQQ